MKGHLESECGLRIVTCTIHGCGIRIPISLQVEHETKACNRHIRNLSELVVMDQKTIMDQQRQIGVLITIFNEMARRLDQVNGVPPITPELTSALAILQSLPTTLINNLTGSGTGSNTTSMAAPSTVSSSLSTVVPGSTGAITPIVSPIAMPSTTLAVATAPSAVSVGETKDEKSSVSTEIDGVTPATSTAAVAVSATSSTPAQNGGGPLLSYDILLVGGVHANSTTDRKAISSAQRFADKIWHALPPMPTPRGWCSAARVDEKIYVTGGSIVGGNRLGCVECFDLMRHEWTTRSPLLAARDEHVTIACDSKIWCIGGVPTGSSQALSSMECYDIRLNEWSFRASMSYGRGYAASAVLGGHIYVFGGKPSLGVSKALTSAERYDPLTNSWSTIAPPLTARSAHRAIVVEGKIILLGGQVSSEDGKTVTAVDTGEEYDPRNDTWSVSNWKLPLPCANFAIHFNDNDMSLIIAGGWPIARSSAAYRRNGQTGNWSLLPPLRFSNYEAAFV
jgi:hypothetical protein